MTAGTNINAGQGAKSPARFIPVIARILLGFGFMIFGLNGFLNFMPAPKDLPPDMLTVMGGLMKGGYMPVIAARQACSVAGSC